MTLSAANLIVTASTKDYLLKQTHCFRHNSIEPNERLLEKKRKIMAKHNSFISFVFWFFVLFEVSQIGQASFSPFGFGFGRTAN